MSNALTRAARPIVLPPTDKAVLMALADMARDPEDPKAPCQAWPPMHGANGSIGLCDWTCLSERTVQRAVKALVAAGHIERRQLSHGALYTLKITIGEASPVTESPDTQSGDRESGDRATPSPVTVAPKASGSTTSKKASPSKRRPGGARNVIEALPDLPAGVTDEQWRDFAENRIALSRGPRPKPWTPGAAKAIITKLHKIAADGGDPSAAIQRSIEEGWAGVFPQEGKRHGTADRGYQPSAALAFKRFGQAQREAGQSQNDRDDWGPWPEISSEH